MFGKEEDPVCGMAVKKKEAAATSEHMGKTYYFCSQTCKEKFDENPMNYMKMGKKEGGSCH
ncbi:MAG TPA: YHS domain-containing protein [Candidatus Latescibacteria bacterium]|nr:YHS domain-containing protein [Candidatus Latescibacterota bacterium]